MTWLITKYVLTAALRDKLLVGFLLLMTVGISLSVFLGSSAAIEKDQFSIVFAASGLRVAGNITLILFAVFYLRRSFESRDVEYLLSRPISRFQFLSAHFLAFSLLAFITAVLVTFVLFSMPLHGMSPNFILWGLSFWIELNIMVIVAMFFSMILSSAVTASLTCFGFYLLARLIGDILGIIEANNKTGFYVVLEKIMLVISVIVPRFDLMAESSWLLYGADNAVNWLFILGQGFVFCGLVFCAALLDLNKRQF